MYLCEKHDDRVCSNACPDFETCDARKIPFVIHSVRFGFGDVGVHESENDFSISTITTEGYLNEIVDRQRV